MLEPAHPQRWGGSPAPDPEGNDDRARAGRAKLSRRFGWARATAQAAFGGLAKYVFGRKGSRVEP
jgi:hypothetical protein